jgi:uncharacterized DUF497 family protein
MHYGVFTPGAGGSRSKITDNSGLHGLKSKNEKETIRNISARWVSRKERKAYDRIED